MSFAMVGCSYHWTATCDAIQARMDMAAPYMIGALAVAIVVSVFVVGYVIHERVKS
jgi:flagellar biosynthesis protein FliQ